MRKISSLALVLLTVCTAYPSYVLAEPASDASSQKSADTVPTSPPSATTDKPAASTGSAAGPTADTAAPTNSSASQPPDKKDAPPASTQSQATETTFCLTPPEPTTGEGKLKDAVIRRILKALNAKPLTEAEKEERKAQTKRRLDHMLDIVCQAADLSAAEKEQLKEKMKKPPSSSGAGGPMPDAKAKAEMLEKLQCKDFVKNATYRVLDDHFNLKELKDLERFIISSTGQKLLAEAPDMVLEGVELGVQQYVPIFADVVKKYRHLHRLMGPKKVPADQQEMLERMKKMFHQRNPDGKDSI